MKRWYRRMTAKHPVTKKPYWLLWLNARWQLWNHYWNTGGNKP